MLQYLYSTLKFTFDWIFAVLGIYSIALLVIAMLSFKILNKVKTKSKKPSRKFIFKGKIENDKVPYLIFNNYLQIIYCNKALSKILGIKRKYLFNRYLSQITLFRENYTFFQELSKYNINTNQKQLYLITNDHKKYQIQLQSEKFDKEDYILLKIYNTSDEIKTKSSADSDGKKISKRINEIKNRILTKTTVLYDRISRILVPNKFKYRNIFTNLPVGIYRTTADGKFLKANQALAEILGAKSIDELYNLSVYNFYESPEIRENLLYLQGLNNEFQKFELKLKRLDGEVIWVYDQAKIYYDKKGKIKWIEGILEDITYRKQAELKLYHSEQRYAGLFKKLLDVYFKIDLHGQILQVSPSIEKILGYTINEILYTNIKDYLIDENNDYHNFLSKILKNGRLNGYLIKIRHKYNSPHYFLVNAQFTLNENGKIDGIDGIARDLTDSVIIQNNLSVLYQIAKNINSTSNWEDIFRNTFTILSQYLGFENYYIALHNDVENRIEFPYVYDKYNDHYDSISADTQNSITAKVIKTGDTIILTNKEISDILKNSPLIYTEAPKNWIGIPLKIADKVIGAIGIKNIDPYKLKSSWLKELLESIAEQLAIAIDRGIKTKELISARERAELLYSISPSCLLAIDTNYRIISCNKRLEELTGYTAEEVIGKNCSIISESLPDEVYLFLTDIEHKPLSNIESIIITKDKSQKIVSKNFEYLKDVRGNISGVIISINDITLRKKAEEQLLWQSTVNHAIAELSRAIISFESLEKLSKQILHNLCNLTGSDIGTIVCLNKLDKLEISAQFGFDEVNDEEFSKKLNYIKEIWIKVIENDEPITINRINSRRQFNLLLNPFPELNAMIISPAVSSRELLGLIILGTKKGEYKENDIDLTFKFASLYGIAYQRFKAEREMRAALEKEQELSELKSRFILMVSHEYRTPLSAIMLSSDILREYSDKLSKSEKDKHFERISQSIKSMTKLLDDIIAFNKIDSGLINFNPEFIDIKPLITSIVHEMELLYRNKCKINLKFHNADALILLDEKLIRQILTNLLSNAIKYSFDGNEVIFNVFVSQDYVEFIIEDFGIGIPEEDQKNMFQPFFRARNVESIQGTGLGMNIVKNCVDLHKGSINFESKLGVGTKFDIIIPTVHKNTKCTPKNK